MTSARTRLEALLTANGRTRKQPETLFPASLYFDLAGEEFGRRLLLTQGNDGTEYCLRPDFTLPLANEFLQSSGAPVAWSYVGPAFRQRVDGPAEFEQAGLELIAQPDPDQALHEVLEFALDALAAYGVNAPVIRLGSVDLFEALLAAADLPDVWRPRLRHRFGHADSIGPLLARLADPHNGNGTADKTREQWLADIRAQMLEHGLSEYAGRAPDEIADRMMEKQALAAAKVPAQTIQLLSAYLTISGAAEAAIGEIADLFQASGLELSAPLEALSAKLGRLAARAPDATLLLDAGFSPRLDYYTGLVFEMTGRGGTILCSGGQYDRLMQRLGAHSEIAASGCALWTARLNEEAGQ